MKKSKFTEAQIIFAIKQSETGVSVGEVCRKMGISEATFYNWKKKFGGLGVSELRKLRQLEEENRQLKKLVADLSLDKQMLESIISLAVSFSSREKRATHNFRISDRETLIADTVNLGMDFIAKMNVQKGEEIDIRLLSNEPHIYFTLTPGVGSNMEHKFWNGPAPFNGDVQIRVFAAEDIDDGRFRLSVKKY